MSYFQVGSLIIRTEWIILIVSIIIGLVTARIRLTKDVQRKFILDRLFNASVIGVLVWKLSIALIDPISVINNPIILLYFTGGDKGIWMGLLVAAAYLVYQTRKYELEKTQMVETVLISLLSGLISMMVIRFFFQVDIQLTEILILSVGLLIYIIYTFFKKGFAKTGRLILILIIVGMAGWAVYDNLFQKETLSKEEENVPLGIKVGEKAPDFQLNTVGGDQIRLADLKGKRVVINLWATWCPPCQAEMPEMVKFYNDHTNADFEILAVNLTNSEKSIDEVETFKEEYNINFPILLDKNGDVGSVYHAFTIPTTYILDENGIIVEKIAGPMSYNWMEKHILTN